MTILANRIHYYYDLSERKEKYGKHFFIFIFFFWKSILRIQINPAWEVQNVIWWKIPVFLCMGVNTC